MYEVNIIYLLIGVVAASLLLARLTHPPVGDPEWVEPRPKKKKRKKKLQLQDRQPQSPAGSAPTALAQKAPADDTTNLAEATVQTD